MEDHICLVYSAVSCCVVGLFAWESVKNGHSSSQRSTLFSRCILETETSFRVPRDKSADEDTRNRDLRQAQRGRKDFDGPACPCL